MIKLNVCLVHSSVWSI